ncbi:thiamine diphosphokinase, partial [Patescibacteria group bacterium]|nr:thiamine diphosphokinase [Patescibacteria group bacterium]
MKRAIIFSNGELADISRLKIKKTDLLIGVDGGTKQILKPDIIIGDFDSLTAIPENVPLIMHPKDKDFTDTELALQFCEKQNIKEVILVGFLGRRLDHLIANLMSLSKYNFK